MRRQARICSKAVLGSWKVSATFCLVMTSDYVALASSRPASRQGFNSQTRLESTNTIPPKLQTLQPCPTSIEARDDANTIIVADIAILPQQAITARPSARNNLCPRTMPAIRSHTARGKKPPAGFDDIREDLEVFGIKMKDAQNTPTENVPKHQAQWPIFQIAHQRSRYVYELYYEKEAISKPLYDWLLKNGYADPILIAKWKKQGYEKVSPASFCFFPAVQERSTTATNAKVKHSCPRPECVTAHELK